MTSHQSHPVRLSGNNQLTEKFHLSIGVKSLTEAVEFYLDVLGAELIFEGDYTNLDLYGTQITLKENSKINVVLEGHADERGTREYNLALGERRANAAKDYLMTYGISGNRISVISYGKERPVDSGSNPLAWSKNRRSVTVKAN